VSTTRETIPTNDLLL